MTRSKFEFFADHLDRKQQAKQKKLDQYRKQIKACRKLVNKYISENNELISKKWEVDLKLGKASSSDELRYLRAKKEAYERKIIEADLDEKISKLWSQIYDLEMTAYGRSNVGNASPVSEYNLF